MTTTNIVDPAEKDLQRLIGLPFDDSDEVIRQAVRDASVPALLMSMVHMSGGLEILDELPHPFMLLSMDLQGGMSEPDKETVRERAFQVICDYRDRGCPPPFVPNETQRHRMLEVITNGPIADDYLDYICADLRLIDADQKGPALESSPQARADFPVTVIGCGEAGLLAGIKLKSAGIPFTIIEKQARVGGTWQANRYPGCRVDINNHYYSYSFEPADHWTHTFSEQPAIVRYLEDVMNRYEIGPHVRFGTEVTSAVWNQESGTWTVEIRGPGGEVETLAARGLICAVGQFSNPVIPDIAGRENFSGPSFHTADWDDGVDLHGKRVAVVGAGASGFQLVPAIAAVTAQVDVYQRTAQWMAPNIDYHEPVPAGERWALRHLPYYARWLRFVSWWTLADAATDFAKIDPDWDDGGLSVSESNKMVRDLFIAWMRNFTGDEELLAKLTPDYPPMGKRTLQDNGTWLAALQRPDVELIREGIAEIVADGVVTVDGQHRPADIVIWATGFDVNHQLGLLDIRGVDGHSLGERWGEAAHAYLGVTVPGFPNMFCMYGPGTNGVNGTSIIYNSECQMRYILGCIDMIVARDARSATVRRSVCDDYTQRSQQRLKTMVYSHPSVASYYKNSAGDLPSLLAWSIRDYWTWTNRPDPDHYEVH